MRVRLALLVNSVILWYATCTLPRQTKTINASEAAASRSSFFVVFMGVHQRIAQQVQVVKYLLLAGSSVRRPFRAAFTNAIEFVNDTRRRTTSYPECKVVKYPKMVGGG